MKYRHKIKTRRWAVVQKLKPVTMLLPHWGRRTGEGEEGSEDVQYKVLLGLKKMSHLMQSNHEDEKTETILQIRLTRTSKRNVKLHSILNHRLPRCTDCLKGGEEERECTMNTKTSKPRVLYSLHTVMVQFNPK